MSKDLNSLIRQVADQHPDVAEPRELARLVASATHVDDVYEFYEESLIGTVRVLIGHRRQAAMTNALSCDMPRTAPPKSAKLQQRRSWWQQMLTERVHVNGAWKVLGDLTINDLRWCVHERQVNIGRIQKQLDNYSTLIAMMQRYGVATVNELPEQQNWPKSA